VNFGKYLAEMSGHDNKYFLIFLFSISIVNFSAYF
jgi:hypothetical protein